MSELVASDAELESKIGSELDWDVDKIVRSLRTIRNNSLSIRNRLEKPAVLPSRKALESVMESFRAALFPHRLSTRQLKRESVDYFVGHCLDSACRALMEQAEIELEYSISSEVDRKTLTAESIRRTRAIAHQLPRIRELLDTDIEAAYQSDPAARTHDEVLACYPGIYAMIHYRIAHQIFEHDLPLIARMISEIAHSKTGIDIHPGAKIGESFFIDHGTGVVIGETSVIGNHVRIHHGVTLGARPEMKSRLVQLQEWSFNVPRHPVVEDNVTINADATLLGRITIGQGSNIGGNVCLTTSVPPHTRVTQAESHTDSFIEGAGI